MKVQLIQKPSYDSAFIQILHNRGIENVKEYLNAGIEDVSPPEALGEDLLKRGAKMLISHISAQNQIMVLLDQDCDGWTSSALILNYIYNLFPSFVNNGLIQWWHREGKAHGLSQDIVDYLINNNFKMIICPDGASGDFIFHKQLKENNIDILILDHHPVNIPNNYQDACIINNNASDSTYPNDQISGVAITWQFCRYLDKINNTNYANDYLDLVSLGVMGDMQDITISETKSLIFEGFKEKNLKNPFIVGMSEKNSFPLSKSDYKPSDINHLQFSPMGAAFFIIPFVNALCRSGTIEEQAIVFQSMLKFKAFEEILSTKRGHKLGEKEQILTQALRTCTNVKNRQTRDEEAGLEKLEYMIEKNHMMEHKVLLFLLDPGEINPGIAGLIANKFVAKYQRPTAILTKVKKKISHYYEDLNVTVDEYITDYEGSARGYDGGEPMDFKAICAEAPGCNFVGGHPNAFGLGLGSEINGEWLYQFLEYTDMKLKDLSSEPSYFVDYIWNYDKIDGDKILEIADMNDYLGKNLNRPLVYIKNIPVNSDTFKVMKSNTLKYNCPQVDIIQFGATDDQIEEFSTGSRIINAVCKCQTNTWNFQTDPQLTMIDYEVAEEKHDILTDWGF